MPVAVHQSESNHEGTNLRVDSIWLDRWHTEYVKGDSVFVKDSVSIDKWHIYKQTDTIRIYRLDSIPYPVEVPKYIRQRNTYDKATARGFWLLLLAALAAGVLKVSKVLRVQRV